MADQARTQLEPVEPAEDRRNPVLTDRRAERCNAPFRETNLTTGEMVTALCNLEYGHKPRRHTRKIRRAKDRNPAVLDRRARG